MRVASRSLDRMDAMRNSTAWFLDQNDLNRLQEIATILIPPITPSNPSHNFLTQVFPDLHGRVQLFVKCGVVILRLLQSPLCGGFGLQRTLLLIHQLRSGKVEEFNGTFIYTDYLKV